MTKTSVPALPAGTLTGAGGSGGGKLGCTHAAGAAGKAAAGAAGKAAAGAGNAETGGGAGTAGAGAGASAADDTISAVGVLTALIYITAAKETPAASTIAAAASIAPNLSRRVSFLRFLFLPAAVFVFAAGVPPPAETARGFLVSCCFN
jgi:hypothetical protein